MSLPYGSSADERASANIEIWGRLNARVGPRLGNPYVDDDESALQQRPGCEAIYF